MKKQYRGEGLPKKGGKGGGLDSLQIKGGGDWQERGVGVFEGVLIP